MNLLMLSWEYPPRIVGGLARHVHALSEELSRLDVNITVLTLGYPGLPAHQKEGKIEVYRINAYRFASPSFLDWVYQFNMTLIENASKIMEKGFHIIHAHDWLVAPAAISLKYLYRLPLFATIHSTEWGRRGGLHDDLQRHIHNLEWLLTYEAWKVAVCSQFMRKETLTLFSIPEGKIDVIQNGVNPYEWNSHLDLQVARSRYALPEEKIILYVGRMVYEKGGQVLLDAAARLAKRNDVKFIFVGDGPIKPQLIRRTQETGLEANTLFTGFINDQELQTLYHLADITVFPSLYEPFGIVALEAMTARKPVIASDVGGLSEIIRHGETGLLVPSNNPGALASAILRLLGDPAYAQQLSENGSRLAEEHYSWEKIAKKTLEVYHQVREEYESSGWKPKT